MSDNLGATKNEIIEYYQDEVATLGREISAKDQRIAELEEKLAAECNTALKATIHDQRRELKRLNERIAELEQQRDALAAELAVYKPLASADIGGTK